MKNLAVAAGVGLALLGLAAGSTLAGHEAAASSETPHEGAQNAAPRLAGSSVEEASSRNDQPSRKFKDMSDDAERMTRVLRASHAPGSGVKVQMSLTTNAVEPQTVGLWIVTPDSRVPLDVGPDGVFDTAPHLESFAAMQGMEISPYEEGFGISMEFRPRLAKDASPSPDAIRKSVREFQQIINGEAGMMRLFAPKIKGVRALTGPSQHAILTLKSGKSKRVEADDDGWVEITWKLKNLETVSLSTLPSDYRYVD